MPIDRLCLVYGHAYPLSLVMTAPPVSFAILLRTYAYGLTEEAYEVAFGDVAIKTSSSSVIVSVGHVGRYHIGVPGAQGHHLVGQVHLSFTIGYQEQSREGRRHFLPVPVGMVACKSHIEHNQAQRFYRYIHGGDKLCYKNSRFFVDNETDCVFCPIIGKYCVIRLHRFSLVLQRESDCAAQG